MPYKLELMTFRKKEEVILEKGSTMGTFLIIEKTDDEETKSLVLKSDIFHTAEAFTYRDFGSHLVVTMVTKAYGDPIVFSAKCHKLVIDNNDKLVCDELHDEIGDADDVIEEYRVDKSDNDMLNLMPDKAVSARLLVTVHDKEVAGMLP